jgi:hypothetical protein
VGSDDQHQEHREAGDDAYPVREVERMMPFPASEATCGLETSSLPLGTRRWQLARLEAAERDLLALERLQRQAAPPTEGWQAPRRDQDLNHLANQKRLQIKRLKAQLGSDTQ